MAPSAPTVSSPRFRTPSARVATALVAAGALLVAVNALAAAPARGAAALELHRDASGAALTLSATGPIDRNGLFFRSLGTNQRSCATCHAPENGWTVTPEGLRRRFEESAGTDPVFRLLDGAVSPHADVSTRAARRKAYGMLLSRGVFRIGMPIPPNAQFELAAVDDPYGYASAAELSLFRRPLPSTNLRFLSTVMWDGRETLPDPSGTDCLFGTTTCFAALHVDLADQANGATLGHAQATTPLTPEQANAIVDFELGLTTAQVHDDDAGSLVAAGARGGPAFLSRQPFWFGINDTLVGDYRTHASFTSDVMALYDAWKLYLPDARRPDAEGRDWKVAVARRAVARGEALFNSRSFTITGVKGLNDDLGVAAMTGTCSSCHNAPNAGDHSVPMPLDIGIADASRRTPDLPLYTLRNKATGETVRTTDPGRALVTGLWKDIGRFKGPTLRALATRAPYFHNGSAQDLHAVVDFYDTRFGIGLTPQEKDDLVAFLKTL